MTDATSARITISTMTSDLRLVLEALSNSPVFSVLSQDVLERLAGTSERQSFATGDIILKEGDPGGYGFLILSGEVSVEVSTPTGPVSVAQIGAGRLVGEIGAFADIPRTADVIALSDVEVLRLDRSTIQRSMGDNMDVAMNLIGRLGIRLQNINRPMAIFTQAAEALRNDTFTPEFLDTLADGADEFAHFAAVFKAMAVELQEKQKQLRELETATGIQHAFLPDGIDLSDHGRSEIQARMIAAKHVGGDFFDYFKVGSSQLGFLIGDVAGKGIPAALFMARTLSVLRAVAMSGQDPGACLSLTNSLISERNDQDMFVTVFYGVIDLQTGSIKFCNAGHEPGIRVGKDGTLTEYEAAGAALGLFDSFEYGTQELQMHSGEMFVVYSDGVTEAFNPDGSMFGEERLFSTITHANRGSAEEMTEAIMGAVDAFADGCDRADDTTVLTLLFEN